MVEVNLGEYCSLLLGKTKSGEYVWEKAGDNKYRLVMKKGSIVLVKLILLTSIHYEISFYGMKDLIYHGTIDQTDSLFKQYKELFEIVVSKNNERINNEITELFGEG